MNGKKGMGVRGPGQRQLEGSFEHGNKLTVPQNGGEFTEYLRNDQLRKKLICSTHLRVFKSGNKKNHINLTGSSSFLFSF